MTKVGNVATTFYTRITDQFAPLVPVPGGPPRAPLSYQEVAAKKPNSSVDGDVLPRLMKAQWRAFITPAQGIFNAVLSSTKWKTETTVVIPKTANPSSLTECRNISCTPFLSKVLKMVVLRDLRAELSIDQTQYGGVKLLGALCCEDSLKLSSEPTRTIDEREEP